MNDLAKRLQDEGIKLRGGIRPGNQKTLCPKCSHTRRKKTDECLSITIEGNNAVWNCHNAGCGFAGSASDRSAQVYTMPKKPVKPSYKPESLPVHTLAWFRARGISEATLMRNGISYDSTRDAVAFPSYRNGEVVNIKYRKLPKSFSQVAGAEQIFYGLDDIRTESETVIVCEGELDKLALEEAGYTNVISLPSGAIKAGSGTDSKQTEFITNSWQNLAHIKIFIMAGDNDAPGKESQTELVRVLGRDKCLFVTWPDSGDAPCKDANETLVAHGAAVLRECIELAKSFPIKNLVEIGDDESSLLQFFREGYGKALSTGWPCVDEVLKINTGLLTVVTGMPGCGKSEFIDHLMVNLAESHDWKFAICSFENPIAAHRSKLIEKYMGKPFWPSHPLRMSEQELLQGAEWVRQHFSFMEFADDSPTIDAILETARGAVRRYGIKGLVVDPYNEIEHKRPSAMTETEYVSEMLSKVKRFAQNHDVHVWFVAHPAKLMRDKDGKRNAPGLYDISGSANWVNKADVGLVVHRDPSQYPPMTEIHIRKMRFKWLGQLGTVNLGWDKNTGRYFDPAVQAREARNKRFS